MRIPSRFLVAKKTSIVWKHFDYDTEKNRSVCNIKETSSDHVCGKEIPGKFPTNLRSHLQKQHPEEYAALRKIEESAKKAKMKQEAEKQQASLKVSHQMTLAESLRCGTYYDKSSARYCDICRKLAIFVGTTNVPCSIVQNLEFQYLLSTLDHRFHVPSRAQMTKELQNVLIELKSKIGEFLEEANKASICADIWSKKGLLSSYLGITAHFFSRKDIVGIVLHSLYVEWNYRTLECM